VAAIKTARRASILAVVYSAAVCFGCSNRPPGADDSTYVSTIAAARQEKDTSFLDRRDSPVPNARRADRHSREGDAPGAFDRDATGHLRLELVNGLRAVVREVRGGTLRQPAPPEREPSWRDRRDELQRETAGPWRANRLVFWWPAADARCARGSAWISSLSGQSRAVSSRRRSLRGARLGPRCHPGASATAVRRPPGPPSSGATPGTGRPPRRRGCRVRSRFPR
jgi:hypothetical protein